MNYLLLEEDEKAFAGHLCSELGLWLLLSDRAPDGNPEVAQDPSTALPPLANPARKGCPDVYELTFWCPALGPICTLGTAPAPKDAIGAVERKIIQDATLEWEDVIDCSRTPVIRLKRTHWQAEAHSRLAPGLLCAMALPKREQPRKLLALYREISRWLMRQGTRLNPFEHCSYPGVRQPRNLNVFWVCAMPAAYAWVNQGGEVWPWNS